MKEWTPEERHAHGLKIAETKRLNRLRLSEGQRVSAEQREIAHQQMLNEIAARHEQRLKTLTWYDLPKNAIKCARNPLVPRDAPVHKSQCYNCRNEMFTRDDKLENICEVCEFDLVNEKHRLRQEREKARGGVAINPFRQENGGGVVINPFNTGRRLL